MKKSVKVSIICILIAAAAVLILIINYRTNYNWRYKELLEKITDVPNKEAITNIDFYSPRNPYTEFEVNVSGEKLSGEEIYSMGHDIAEKIDQHIHYRMEQTLDFYIKEITLRGYDPDTGLGISCNRYAEIENGEPKYYTWYFKEYPSEKAEEKITPVIYPEE